MHGLGAPVSIIMIQDILANRCQENRGTGECTGFSGTQAY